MSVDALTAVWRYSQAPDMASLLVLVAMADWSDHEGYSWASRRALCLKTGASETTLKRVIRGHMTRGELERFIKGHNTHTLREFIGRTGFQPTNLYRITLLEQLGTKRPDPTLLARNRRGAIQTPLSVVAGDAKGGHTRPEGGAVRDPKGGPDELAPLCTDTSEVTSEDTSVLIAGAPRPHEQPAEKPRDNVGVITKLAHEVLDLFAETVDIEYGELVESVKQRCALLNIDYDSGVVGSALDSALYQRRLAGKPSLCLGSAGDAAFRLPLPRWPR